MNYDDYKVNIPYPDRPQKPRLAKTQVTAKEAREYADALEKWEKDMVEFRKAEAEYHQAEQKAMEKFRSDVLKENGLEKHPAADKVYSLAWEEGHSGGYSEIANWVSTLADFARDLEICIITAQSKKS